MRRSQSSPLRAPLSKQSRQRKPQQVQSPKSSAPRSRKKKSRNKPGIACEGYSRPRQSGEGIRGNKAQRRLVGLRPPRRRLAFQRVEARRRSIGLQRDGRNNEGSPHQ